MKKLLLKRILPFMMALIMLSSFCLPVGAFTMASQGRDEEGTPYCSIELQDGILRVKLNPQKVYDALRDGNLSPEELEQFVPADVSDALSAPSADALLTLAAQYFSAEDIQALLRLLPEEILNRYFLNLEFLESLVTLDEILGALSMDDLFAEVRDTEKFNRELNELVLPVLDTLLTENVQNQLLSCDDFLKEILVSVVPRLWDEHKDEVLAALPNLVTSDVIDQLVGNATYQGALAGLVSENDYAVLNQLTASESFMQNVIASPEFLQVVSTVVDGDLIRSLAALPSFDITRYATLDESFANACGITAQNLQDKGYVSADDVQNAVLNGTLPADFGVADLLNSGLVNVSALLRDSDYDITPQKLNLTAATMQTMASDMLADSAAKSIVVDAFADKVKDGSVSAVDFLSYIDFNSLLIQADPVVSYEQVAVALGRAHLPSGTTAEQRNKGFSVLASLLDPAAVQSNLGSLLLDYVTFSQIVEEVAGDYDTLLSWYDDDPDVLMQAVESIGLDKIVAFLKSNDLLLSNTAKNAAKTLFQKILQDKTRLKNFVLGCKEPILQIVLDEVATVKLNGTEIFKYGRFNLQAALQALAESIPDVESFCNMNTGDAVWQLMLKVSFQGNDVPMTVGCAVLFDGDFTQLQELAAQHEDLFRLTVEDGLRLAVSSALPAKVTDLYRSLLESDKLSDSTKAKILTLPTTSLSNLSDFFGSFSDEELNSLAEVVNQKLDGILNKASALTSKLPGQTGDLVDGTLNLLRTADGWRTLFDKISALANKLPDGAKNFTLTQLYGESGSFALNSTSFTFDLADRIPQLASLPEGLLNTEISGSIAATLSFAGLYSLTLTEENGTVHTFFLPAGTSTDILQTVSGLDLTVFGENLPATMPAADTKVFVPLQPDEYELIFVMKKPDGSTEELDRIRYLFGDTTLSREPAEPTEIRGYRAIMPDYSALMNQTVSKTVEVTYEIIQYTLSFNLQNGTTQTVPFTVNTDADTLTFPTLSEETPAWTYVWRCDGSNWTKDSFKAYLADATQPLKNLTVSEAAVAKEYTLTFKNSAGVVFDEVSYTVNGLNEGERLPVLPTAPTGYTHSWKNETDNTAWNPDTFVPATTLKDLTIAVVATPIQYTYKFVKMNGNETTVSYTIETTAEQFRASVPALSVDETGAYSYQWKRNNAVWTADSFQAGNADALGDYTIRETKVKNQFTLTITKADGTTVDVRYDVDSVAADFEEVFALPAPTASYTYKWQIWVPDPAPSALESEGSSEENGHWEDWDASNFDPAADFGSYKIRQVKVANEYTYTFVLLNGNRVTVTYTIETTRQAFAAQIPALTVAGNAYSYVWQMNGANWTSDNFVAGSEAALGNYTVTEKQVPKTYTVTFNLANGTQATANYNVNTTAEEFAAQIPQHPQSRAYSYRWVKGSAEWSAGNFEASDLSNYTVTEEKTLINYTYTFRPLQGNDVVLNYNFETTAEEFAAAFEAQVPALTTQTSVYSYVWRLNGTDWSVDSFVAGSEDALNNYTVLETQMLRLYTVTFEAANGTQTTVTYNRDTTAEEFAAQIPQNTVSRAYTYRWVKGNADWSADDFDASDLTDYTVTEVGTLINYTYTFRPLQGNEVVVNYNFETTAAEFAAQIPALTEANRAYSYEWQLNGTAWTADSFVANSETALGNYTVLEVQSLKTYTITVYKISSISTKGVPTYVTVPQTLTYTVNGLTEGSSFPNLRNNMAKKWNIVWQRDNQDWSTDDFDPNELTDFTIRETVKLINYTLTFHHLDGRTTTIEFNCGSSTAAVKFPTLTANTNIIKYRWYYLDASDVYKPRTSISPTSTSFLKDDEYWELGMINDKNKLKFYVELGGNTYKSLSEYDDPLGIYVAPRTNELLYTDANVNFLYEKLANNQEVLHTGLYDAPARKGYRFIGWYYKGTNTPFDLNTFRDNYTESTYGSNAATVELAAKYEAITYTLTFEKLDGTTTPVTFTVESAKNTLALSIPTLPDSNRAYSYYWTDENGNNWTFENHFNPQEDLADQTITAHKTPVQYVVTFIRADQTRKNVLLTIETTKAQFLNEMPILENNAAFERSWLYNGSTWTVNDLFVGEGESVYPTEDALNEYVIYEKEIAYSFMLTFKDLNGNLITRVIYNGHGPLFGELPALPSSNDGYAYSWWNNTANAAWGGFDAMACENLELQLRRETITYTLTFKTEGKDDVIKTYTVSDQSFEVPTVVTPAGYRLNWYYMDGEVKKDWVKEDLWIGDMVLTSEFIPLTYTVTFTAENGSKYVFNMTVTTKSNPSVPPKAGHIGTWYVQVGSAPADSDPTWASYQLTSGGQIVTAYVKYSALPYQVHFMVNGEFYRSASYVLNGDWTAPEAPAKEGYTAEWYIDVDGKAVKWEDYELEGGSSSMTANLVYTPIQYTAKFYADGKLIASVPFTVEDKKLSKVPNIPQKEGFTAEWEAYTIGAKDLEIHAVYSDSQANPWGDNKFIGFLDSVAGGLISGLYENDDTGIHWIWWIVILLCLILLVLTLILFLVAKCKKKQTPPPAPEPEPEPNDEPETPAEEPEDESDNEPEEPEPEEKAAPEIEAVESIDVQTADAMMKDEEALTVLESVDGANEVGMKAIINISDINEAFEANETVDLDSLKAKKLISPKAQRVKILANGRLEKPLTVIADSFSVQAIKMITLTGGKAIQKKISK